MRGVPAERAFERVFRAAPREAAAEEAWRAFAEHGLPTARDEDWRFTPLAALESLEFTAPEAAEIPADALEAARARVGDARRSTASTRASLGSALDPKLAPFAALNAALAEGGERIEVSADCSRQLPFPSHSVRLFAQHAVEISGTHSFNLLLQ